MKTVRPHHVNLSTGERYEEVFGEGERVIRKVGEVRSGSLEDRFRRLEEQFRETDINHIRLGPRRETEAERMERVQEVVDRITEAIQDKEKTTMRCKVVCNFKQDSGEGVNLTFGPVYTGSEENKAFFKATPGGTISFYTVNRVAADRFEQGKEYYVDFSPAL